MSKYNYLLFDLDDTILDFERCELDALRKTFYTFSVPFNDNILSMYMDINNNLWKQHDSGIIEQKEVLVNRFDMLFEKIKISASPQAVSAKYQEFLSETAFFEEDALDVIVGLYQKFELYIVSNGNTKTQKSRIQRAGLNKYFNGIFISEALGFHKPQKEFFDKCFLQIKNFNRYNTLIIGDSLSSDMLGGINAGIQTCWYNPNFKDNYLKIKLDYEISKMSQIFDIVKL